MRTSTAAPSCRPDAETLFVTAADMLPTASSTSELHRRAIVPPRRKLSVHSLWSRVSTERSVSVSMSGLDGSTSVSISQSLGLDPNLGLDDSVSVSISVSTVRSRSQSRWLRLSLGLDDSVTVRSRSTRTRWFGLDPNSVSGLDGLTASSITGLRVWVLRIRVRVGVV